MDDKRTRTAREVFKQIEQEHEDLRNLLGTVHRSLAILNSPVGEISELLAKLCAELDVHFHDEEDGGFFSQIVDQAPRFSRRADKLCEEHEIMLLEARVLAEEASQGDGSRQWRRDLADAFHVFSRRLMHHEGEENQLLQEAYSEDIGAQD